MKLIGLLSVILITSCTTEAWTDTEQSEFVDGCLEEGGGKYYCNCFMQTTMAAYPRYKESKQISFEEAVELSKKCD